MDVIGRALLMYVVLLAVFRLAGKRTMGNGTAFDFVLLLIIAEATQQALVGDDFSLTNAALLILTLVMTDIGLSQAKQRWPAVSRIIDGRPVVLVEDGRLRTECLRYTRVDIDDILVAAREKHGLERLDQVKYAVLELSGNISIVPR